MAALGSHPGSSQSQHDWSHDLVLRALQDLEDPVGSFVRGFPGRAALQDHPDWLENWYIALATRFRGGTGPDLKKIVASAADDGELSLLAKEAVGSSLRLLSLRPTWFRGFRGDTPPIQFEADLVVIEGRNSSGKTSISEAIEWVFTGQLSRRTSGQHGHPTELADCIANEFRPDGTDTSVELTLEVDGETLVLTRVLKRDYSTVATDSSESDLLVNGEGVSGATEQQLFERLLAGIHPILMQHNLRRFVHDDPTSRRQYFERLLQIDELTALVEKAVIGRKRAQEIPNPTGGTGLAALRDFAGEVERAHGETGSSAAKALRKLERAEPDKIPSKMPASLVHTAKELLADEVEGASGISGYRAALEDAQQRQRESRLPLLTDLEAARTAAVPSAGGVRSVLQELRKAVEAVEVATEAAAQISAAQQQIVRATAQLISSGLIDPQSLDDQDCPVCEDGVLTPRRVVQITSWGPLTEAVETAVARRKTARIRVSQEIDRLKSAVAAVLPPELEAKAAEEQLSEVPPRARELGRGALRSAKRLRVEAQGVIRTIEQIAAELQDDDLSLRQLHQRAENLDACLSEFLGPLSAQREDVENLREAVGAASRDDARYRLREKWLKAAGLTEATAEDVAWEAAKRKASEALEGLREGLIELRTEIVEDARRTFSEDMTEVWSLLRQDSGASFSQLHVPPARGKGFKLEFELKAVISDGSSDSEVDALRVFSESQVNVVGIAAYVTRAKRLGHELLIFDDPVQSMDEEHFRSFAADLLPALVDEGHQVVILTHSDAFAACVHDHHYRRESYATMSTRSSKRKGCCVDEGSRRVAERLKTAEKAAEDGDLQRAWRFVRLAMERMYTLVMANADERFKPDSWRGLTAEDMWNRGVGAIISDKAPGKGGRLKEILSSTAAGAHDKPAGSETDLVAAVKDLRALLVPLRLGAG